MKKLNIHNIERTFKKLSQIFFYYSKFKLHFPDQFAIPFNVVNIQFFSFHFFKKKNHVEDKLTIFFYLTNSTSSI